MKDKRILTRLKDGAISFYMSPSGKNELFFLILFGCYVAFNFFLKIEWNDNIDLDYLRVAFVLLIMLGSAIYLVFAIAEWKHLVDRYLWALFLAGVILLVIASYFSTKLSTNAFGVVFDLYFCLMVIGKDYKKILRNTMWIGIVTLAICALGLPLGITKDVVKPENIHPGHSLGTVYPNTWGYLAFLILLIVWYLYLRRKTLKHVFLTFAAFWGTSAFMFFYINCRTIAGLTIIFPFFAILVDWFENRADQKAKEDLAGKALEAERKHKLELERKHTQRQFDKNKKNTIQDPTKSNINNSFEQKTDIRSHKPILSIIQWLVTAIPFISFAFVMYASSQYKWIHDHLYYTVWHNMAMRFVQGGMYFEVYGIPLVGNPYDARNIAYVDISGDFLQVGILDSSFASYIIMRGFLWIILCMLWLSIANWKAMKKRDYAIPLIGLFIIGYAMMERPGLELWYNFILLYPLAKVVSKPGTEFIKERKSYSYKKPIKNRKRK